jgi:hypothetical protein
MTTLPYNLQAVRTAIAAAAVSAHRNPDDITLLAVSKTYPDSVMRCAFAAGQRCFGESYLQEALGKMSCLQDLSIEWHFIGPIQSNKTREIAANFAWVHSVDRYKIAGRLSLQRPAHLPPLQLCLQVNISGEKSKGGVSIMEAGAMACAIASLPNLHLRGLMCIPAPSDDVIVQRAAFASLRELYQSLNAQGLQLDTLSMGMSHDFTAAIAEGATIVRIGTSIFGTRI